MYNMTLFGYWGKVLWTEDHLSTLSSTFDARPVILRALNSLDRIIII